MDTIDILRFSYLAATAGGILVAATPALSQRFLAYGPRASQLTTEKRRMQARDGEREKDGSASLVAQLLDRIAALTVPHDYFWTFYLLSTSLSIFWAVEIFWLKGPTFEAVARHTRHRTTSMSFEQVEITWAMMAVQGMRRLYESLSLTKTPSSKPNISKMQAWHWILGLSFYLATNMAVWVEGIPVSRTHQPSLRDLTITAPTIRTIAAILIFILASGVQHDCHTYLAHLKASKSKDSDDKLKEGEYKIPTHPAFHSLIAPHYTAECAIYLSLAIVAAPQGHLVNGTLACALLFVIANLGVTAGGTRQWYERRFGPEAVKGKWNMIPFVY